MKKKKKMLVSGAIVRSGEGWQARVVSQNSTTTAVVASKKLARRIVESQLPRRQK